MMYFRTKCSKISIIWCNTRYCISLHVKKGLKMTLFDFIEKSPTAYHAVSTIEQELIKHGFTKLDEKDSWNLSSSNKYFATRNDSSIIAFVAPDNKQHGFHIIASHSDSPTFRIKENPEITVEGHYVKLNTEKYGGMIMSSWFDRPLSIAGRLIVKDDDKLKSVLINIDRDLCMIPNLAIHMNRECNDGYKYNAAKDTLPIITTNPEAGKLIDIVAKEADIKSTDILGSDLFLYNRQKGCTWGIDNEFISIGRLDDLQCAYGSLMGFFLTVDNTSDLEHIPVYCVFDNEEVGSGTKQGADSTFLYDILTRINESSGGSQSDYLRHIAASFMISADNAHALHPNYADKSDSSNKVFLNEGIVLKYSANQKYTTDGAGAAYFKLICSNAGINYQTFFNRSDMLGGSTLGNISTSHVSIPSVDIGLPQLAMHSSYETAGAKDTADLVKLAAAFYV